MKDISLYINQQQADLSDNSFVLLNIAIDDLTDPTIVRNSYTQEVKLPNTAANSRIFGHYSRLDRQTTSDNYDASQRVPFVIYDSNGTKLYWGYCKLNEVSADGYSITLYGGLGAFLQALTYNTDGTTKTLADLDYISGEVDELDFDITAATVQEAWTCLQDTPMDEQNKYNIINFAPAYNGIPEGDFDPKHGLVKAADVGLQTQTVDGYKTQNGYTLVSLPDDVDEWAAKDLRCYLQRPVISLAAVFRAMADTANNGGWVFDYSVLDGSGYLPDNWHLSRLWLTLPMIPSLGGFKTSGDAVVHLDTTTATADEVVAEYSITGGIPSGATSTATMLVNLQWNKGAGNSSEWKLQTLDSLTAAQTVVRYSVSFMQMLALDASGAIMGGSKIRAIGIRAAGSSLKELADKCGVVMGYNAGDEEQYDNKVYDQYGITLNTTQLRYKPLTFEVQARGVASYQLVIVSGYYKLSTNNYTGIVSFVRNSFVTGLSSPIIGFVGEVSGTTKQAASTFVQPMIDRPVYYNAPSSLRSGSHISKSLLLSATETPAAYLLGLVKMFGLVLYCDPDEQKVTITTRNDWYSGGHDIDITARVDNSSISIKPIVYDAQVYEFSPNNIGGRFADEYKAAQGVEYGAQRVNTGYAFDSDTKTLTDGIIYKAATPVLAHSAYLNRITYQSIFRPSPFIGSGCKQTLWTTEGESTELDISAIPSAATVSYLNDSNKGYDYPDAVKLEFRDASGKPKDGEGVLCMFNGWQTYDWFKLSDDLGLMDAVNDGKACWLLDKGAGVHIPLFSREVIDGGSLFDCLDYGAAKVLDIPDTIADTETTVYQQAWRAYLTDRFDKSTKVLTCSVDLRGCKIDNQLFRHFYFYRNCWWVLQSIENHSITTDNLTKCTFVQVQEKTAYTDGQFKQD